LDDGYNCNIVGAKAALEVLGLFEGRKCVVTPGIIECGILEAELNGELGKAIAKGGFDKVIFVGDTLIGAVKDGYQTAGGDMQKAVTVKTLGNAQTLLGEWIEEGDCVLFLNDLPDSY
jgi:UDP-N-acetylmuramyl pentapeptide synthase